jgi:hypothetical protein
MRFTLPVENHPPPRLEFFTLPVVSHIPTTTRLVSHFKPLVGHKRLALGWARVYGAPEAIGASVRLIKEVFMSLDPSVIHGSVRQITKSLAKDHVVEIDDVMKVLLKVHSQLRLKPPTTKPKLRKEALELMRDFDSPFIKLLVGRHSRTTRLELYTFPK